MSVHRRPVGRARLLAVLGALVILVGCVMPWWSVGGSNGLPALSGNAFAGMGIVVFVVALATIALVSLPYAMDRPVGADRWPAYAIITALGWVAFAARIIDLVGLRAFTFEAPADVLTRGPGLWLAGVGLLMLARATYEIFKEPGHR
jgi:hypothetical protein